MPVRSRVLLVLAVIWLWPAGALSQLMDLDAAYKRYGDLNSQGRYQDALPFARKALRLGEREFGSDHPATATMLANLARLHRSQGRHGDAKPLYKRALAIREKVLNPEHPLIIESLENYAALLHKTGRGDEAARMEARAKTIRAKRAKDDPAK